MKKFLIGVLLAIGMSASSCPRPAFAQSECGWSMQANEIGVVIIVLPNPSSGGSGTLAGATAWLRSTDSSGNTKNFSLTVVNADGTNNTCGTGVNSGNCGRYSTQANDFPSDGNYQEQLVASYSGGSVVLRSPVCIAAVGNSLSGTP